MSVFEIVDRQLVEGPIGVIGSEEFEKLITKDFEIRSERVREMNKNMNERIALCKLMKEREKKEYERENAIMQFERVTRKRCQKLGWNSFRIMIVLKSQVFYEFGYPKFKRRMKKIEKKNEKYMLKGFFNEKKNPLPVLEAKSVVVNCILKENVLHVIQPVSVFPKCSGISEIHPSKIEAHLKEKENLLPVLEAKSLIVNCILKENVLHVIQPVSVFPECKRISEIHPFKVEAYLKGGSQGGSVFVNLENKIAPKQILHEFLQKKGEKLPIYEPQSVSKSKQTCFGCKCLVYIKNISYRFEVKPIYTRIKDAEHAVAEEAYKKLASIHYEDEFGGEINLVNYKSRLQEVCFKKGLGYPIYNSQFKGSGFETILLLAGREFIGSGRKKKFSEQESARLCLEFFQLGYEDSRNFKTQLYVYSQTNKIEDPKFAAFCKGPYHDLLWRVECSLGELSSTSFWHKTKKKAEQESARLVYDQIQFKKPSPPGMLLNFLLKDQTISILEKIEISETIKEKEEGNLLMDEMLESFMKDLSDDEKEVFHDSSSVSGDDSVGDEILL